MKKIPYFLLLLFSTLFSKSFLFAQGCGTCVGVSLYPTMGPNCEGSTINLNAIVGTGYTFLDCAWSPSAGLSSPTSLSTDLIVPATNTTYCITVNALSNTNEIVNGDFSAGNVGFTSGYTFYPTTSYPPFPGANMGQGLYAVDINSNLPHSLAASCTDANTPNNQMFLGNGHPTPGVPAWQQVVAVCPGDKYRFSASYMKWSVGSDPVMDIRINGTLVNTTIVSSGTCIWQTAQVDYTVPVGTTSITISISDQNAALESNDFAIDAISLRRYCKTTACTNVLVSSVASISGPKSICEYSTHTYTSSIPGGYWTCSAGATITGAGVLTAGAAGACYVTYTVPPGCSTVYKVCVDPIPTIDAVYGPDTLCKGETTTFYTSGVTGIGSGTFGWSYVSTSGPSSVTFGMGDHTFMTATAGSPGTGLVYFNISNCCASASASYPLYIAAAPSVTSLIYTGCMFPCPGMPLDFTVTGTIGATVYYTWSDWSTGGGGTSSTLIGSGGTGHITLPGAGGVGTVDVSILYVVGKGGCRSQGGPKTSVKIIKPDAIIKAHDTICAGESAILDVYGPAWGFVDVKDLTTGIITTISLDGSGYGGITGVGSATVTPSVTTTYEIVSITGCCTVAGSGVSVTIYVRPAPVVTLTHTACQGNPLTLFATSTPPATYYEWIYPGSSSTVSTTTSPVHVVTTSATPAHNGVYTVRAWVDGCPATATTSVNVILKPTITGSDNWIACPLGDCCNPFFHSDVYPVTVLFEITVTGYPIPSGSSLWTAGPFYQSLSMTGTTPIMGCDISSGVWGSYGGPISPSGAGPLPAYPCPPSSIYLQPSYVHAVGVTYNGCSFKIDVPVDPSCADDPAPKPQSGYESQSRTNQNSSLTVVPNPNTGTFVLRGTIPTSMIDKELLIEAVDVIGRSVYKKVIIPTSNTLNENITIDRNIPAGNYILKLESEKISSVIKFSLEK